MNTPECTTASTTALWPKLSKRPKSMRICFILMPKPSVFVSIVLVEPPALLSFSLSLQRREQMFGL